jgi:hypothetical protein
MLIKGYNDNLRGETPTVLRMRVLAPTTIPIGLSVILTETQRKAPFSAPYQSSQDAHMLENWLEMQPQPFGLMPTRTTLLCGLRISFLD